MNSLFFPGGNVYIVRYWLQPYGGPVNSRDSRCRDLDPDFDFFEGRFFGTIGPKNWGRGDLGKLGVA